jgi:hypothetical protein
MRRYGWCRTLHTHPVVMRQCGWCRTLHASLHCLSSGNKRKRKHHPQRYGSIDVVIGQFVARECANTKAQAPCIHVVITGCSHASPDTGFVASAAVKPCKHTWSLPVLHNNVLSNSQVDRKCTYMCSTWVLLLSKVCRRLRAAIVDRLTNLAVLL